ncbi:DJ-1/PfpI family protein [Archangium violaceum]|uniref:DJ-1/PfpI family protein n=1 Tax=Archangium violaceum TaxID=83451 RepID=UPI0037C0C7C8
MSRFASLLLLTLALAPGVAASADPHPPHYACPPCGNACDAKRHDKPGTCPYCGMKLQRVKDESRAQAAPPRPRVAILLFDGVEIIDFTGPYEFFGAAQFDVYTVAESHAPVTTAMGMTVVPKYGFADAPQADVLVVPGGTVADVVQREPVLAWVKAQSAGARQTMSVCNGAFLLAGAGLLDGLTATTTFGNLDRLRAAFPKVKVVDDVRFVDNGRVLTTGGLSAGIDGALHVVRKLEGLGLAQQVALAGEYDWRPEAPFVRGALADRLIPQVDMDALGDWTVTRTQGGTDRWELELTGSSALSAAQLQQRLGEGLVKVGGWARAAEDAPGRSTWTFRGRAGEPWTGVLTVEPVAGGKGRYAATLRIARAG